MRKFRQICLWPVQLMPRGDGATLALIPYIIAKPKRLSEFLDSLSDERLNTGRTLACL